MCSFSLVECLNESFAYVTKYRLFTRVNYGVFSQVTRLLKHCIKFFTSERFLACMNPFVFLQAGGQTEGGFALSARTRSDTLVQHLVMCFQI